MCTYECTLLSLRRLLLALENGGRGGLNPNQTGNKLSHGELLFGHYVLNSTEDVIQFVMQGLGSLGEC